MPPVPLPRRPARAAAVVLLGLAVSTAALVPLPATAAPDPGSSPSSPDAAAAVVDVPVGVWPLDPVPEVVARFDPPETPYGRGHRGVDLLGRPGAVVRASLAGTVTYAGPLAGLGVVVVDHGPTRTTYQPVEATVAVGDAVPAGGPIGLLGAAGSHCAPSACLHWGWVAGETYLDPLLLVGGGQSACCPSTVPRTRRRGSRPRPGGFRPGGGPDGRPGATGRS